MRADREPLAAAGAEVLLGLLTASDAMITAKAARATALEASAGVPVDVAVDQLRTLQADGELLKLVDGRYTTRAHRTLERDTARAARQLVGDVTGPIAADHVQAATGRLADRLAASGGLLTAEQERAIAAGCSESRLVVIEGHAGTGKSTVLAAIALAHQADGRQITVVSTAGLAAQHLANELRAAGVGTAGYSTVAFAAGVRSGAIRPGPEMTVIHDEAALASTHDHLQLLTVAEQTGARVIVVGDRAQSQPVAAGGLWPSTDHAARGSGAAVKLTHNVRARRQSDCDQQHRFRTGDIAGAVAGYHQHGQIRIEPDQRQAEDRALEAAHADGLAGPRTLVVTQTSNQRLDALNARAQAIRLEHGTTSTEGVAVPGRPYRLHPGDPVQIRRTNNAPGEAPLRNGTRATVANVDTRTGTVTLDMPGADPVVVDQQQVAALDLRLAYVQHPFPAQGQTTDTTHVLVSELATREGSYVALTRARETTTIYSATKNSTAPTRIKPGLDRQPDRVGQLAELMGQPESKVASITTPLAHEHQLAAGDDADRDDCDQDPRPAAAEQTVPEPTGRSTGVGPGSADQRHGILDRACDAIREYRTKYGVADDDRRLLGPEPPPGAFTQRHERNQAYAQAGNAGPTEPARS